jgi:hypothetical protein
MHAAIADTQAEPGRLRRTHGTSLNAPPLARSASAWGKLGKAHLRLGQSLTAAVDMPEQPINPERTHSQLRNILNGYQDKRSTCPLKATFMQARLEQNLMAKHSIQTEAVVVAGGRATFIPA